jgi:hypothetical protein
MECVDLSRRSNAALHEILRCEMKVLLAVIIDEHKFRRILRAGSNQQPCYAQRAG